MDHTSELESMAAHHQHVNSDEEEDMLLEELDLKTPKQISLAHPLYAGVYRPIADSRTKRHQAPRIKRGSRMRRGYVKEIIRERIGEFLRKMKMVVGILIFVIHKESVVQALSGWFTGTGVCKLLTGTVNEAEDYEVLGFRTGTIRRRLHSFISKTGHLSSSSHTQDVSLKSRDHNKNRASMQKASSWITTVTFPGCLLPSNYRPYSILLDEQRSSFSIWLPLLGMLNFTAFLSSLFLMVICGAHFTRLHVISALLISAMLFIMSMLI